MHESVTYQAIIDEGQVKHAHRVLLRLGRKRFGQPDKATQQAIKAITDLKKLNRMVDRLLEVETWHDLLKKH